MCVEIAELDTNGVGVGMEEIIENGEGLSPCTASGVEVTDLVVGVTEVGEGLALVVAVADDVLQAYRLLVTGDGLSVLAKVVMRVAQTVQHRSFRGRIVDRPGDGERLLTVDESLLVVSEQGMVPTDPVQSPRLTAGVVGARYNSKAWYSCASASVKYSSRPSSAAMARCVLPWRVASPSDL
jgi:hypothetical protein